MGVRALRLNRGFLEEGIEETMMEVEVGQRLGKDGAFETSKEAA